MLSFEESVECTVCDRVTRRPPCYHLPFSFLLKQSRPKNVIFSPSSCYLSTILQPLRNEKKDCSHPIDDRHEVWVYYECVQYIICACDEAGHCMGKHAEQKATGNVIKPERSAVHNTAPLNLSTTVLSIRLLSCLLYVCINLWHSLWFFFPQVEESDSEGVTHLRSDVHLLRTKCYVWLSRCMKWVEQRPICRLIVGRTL